MAARPLIGREIFDFFSETAEQNSTKPDRKQDLDILYEVCVFSGRSENKMPIANRQLSIKSFDSHGWFIKLRELQIKYDFDSQK